MGKIQGGGETYLPPNTNTHIPQRRTMLPRNHQHMAPRQGHDIQKRQDALCRENQVRMCLRRRWVRSPWRLRAKWRRHTIVLRRGCAWIKGERGLGGVCWGDVAERAVFRGVHGCICICMCVYGLLFVWLLRRVSIGSYSVFCGEINSSVRCLHIYIYNPMSNSSSF